MQRDSIPLGKAVCAAESLHPTECLLSESQLCFSSCSYLPAQTLPITWEDLGIVWAAFFGHTDAINRGWIRWACGFGKRLTWRRGPHGLVGWETTVNSGPFSQLPGETNTNDYPSIVSMEVTRHSRMLTKSNTARVSLAWGLWGASIWVDKTTAGTIIKPFFSSPKCLQFVLISLFDYESSGRLQIWTVYFPFGSKKELISVWVANTQLHFWILYIRTVSNFTYFHLLTGLLHLHFSSYHSNKMEQIHARLVGLGVG